MSLVILEHGTEYSQIDVSLASYLRGMKHALPVRKYTYTPGELVGDRNMII